MLSYFPLDYGDPAIHRIVNIIIIIIVAATLFGLFVWVVCYGGRSQAAASILNSSAGGGGGSNSGVRGQSKHQLVRTESDGDEISMEELGDNLQRLGSGNKKTGFRAHFAGYKKKKDGQNKIGNGDVSRNNTENEVTRVYCRCFLIFI